MMECGPIQIHVNASASTFNVVIMPMNTGIRTHADVNVNINSVIPHKRGIQINAVVYHQDALHPHAHRTNDGTPVSVNAFVISRVVVQTNGGAPVTVNVNAHKGHLPGDALAGKLGVHLLVRADKISCFPLLLLFSPIPICSYQRLRRHRVPPKLVELCKSGIRHNANASPI
jgi:hypothetical protein